LNRTILITGCASGIGETCALGLKSRGWRVFATARKSEDVARLAAEGFESLRLDYADSRSISDCVAEVARRTGGTLDALFNNGAFAQPGALEDISRDVLRAQFETNVFGWHELTRACLPLMRSNGRGRIVNVSSVLGLVALKWRGAYSASKFAIEALSDAMRLELKGSGIDVILIEPGPIATNISSSALAAFDANIDQAASTYRDIYARRRKRLTRPGRSRFTLPPSAVLAKLIQALDSDRPKARYYVTVPTYIVSWARRLLPQRALDRLLDRFSKG
jgi:NAD(P)-dependent dehydrogenase (short-subunit alcohol dehydrogenase family)